MEEKIRSPHKRDTYEGLFVDPLGLEPRMAGPKPAVLPITPWVNTTLFEKRMQIYDFF